MSRIFFSLVAVFGLLTSVSNASTIGSVLGATNRISDNSLEALWNKPAAGPFSTAAIGTGFGNTIVEVGDRLVAIGRIDQVTRPFPGGPTANFPTDWSDEFTFASVIEVTGKAGGPGAYTYTFGPTSTADPLGLGWVPGTAIAFYSDAANNFSGAPASIASGLSQSTGGVKWWEFGFNGTSGEFWNALTFTDDIAAIGAAPPSATGGLFNFGLNLLKLNSGTALASLAGGLEITGSGNLVGAGGPLAGGWQSLDNYDASLNTVPEPTSAAVFGLLSVLGLVRARRRS